MVEEKERAAREKEDEAKRLQEQLEETRKNMEEQQAELQAAQDAAKAAAIAQTNSTTSHVVNQTHVHEYEMNDDADEYGTKLKLIFH